MTVANILSGKGHNVITAGANDSIAAIVKTLAEKRIGAVLVTKPDGSLAGIVSERDVIRALAERGNKAMDAKAQDIMTAKVHTCAPDDSEGELMAMMTVNRIRHLPVMKAGKLAGMISIGDVVKFRMEAIEREAEEMKSYIASAG
jgi:CBS domain-containing protein